MQEQSSSSHLEDTHPFEVHKQEFTQCDVGGGTVFVVDLVVPPAGPRHEINIIVDVVRLVRKIGILLPKRNHTILDISQYVKIFVMIFVRIFVRILLGYC